MFSRHEMSEPLENNPPSKSKEGAGNAGCALHPWPPVQQKSTGVSNQGYTASTGIPCTMVLRLIRDLPGDHACLPPSSADRSAHLAPASERQDHAISPSAGSLIRRARNCACGYRVHRIPLPTSVTTAKRPSCGNGTATNVNLIWGLREAIYFCREGWTGFCKGEVICPTGSHTTRHIATERRCEHAIQRTSKHGVATSSLRARSNPEPRGQSLS
jgi:hypothetical protein